LESGLPDKAFRRYDETPDTHFYAQPRLVTHIDDSAVAAVVQLYRELLPEHGAVLDLMSSWVSHLPPDVRYSRVAGVGLNAVELEHNARLDERVVQDLNLDPVLPFEDAAFDAAVCCVSIQYLVRPVEVLREVRRVVKTGGPLVVAYSNRCFPTKAVAVWQMLDDVGHGRLIEAYLLEAGGWEHIEVLDRMPQGRGADPLYAVVARAAEDATA